MRFFNFRKYYHHWVFVYVGYFYRFSKLRKEVHAKRYVPGDGIICSEEFLLHFHMTLKNVPWIPWHIVDSILKKKKKKWKKSVKPIFLALKCLFVLKYLFVVFTGFYLFVMYLIQILKEQCFKASKVPLDEYLFHWNAQFC